MTRARELRFVVVVVDYDVATHLFRDDDSMPQGVIPCLERHRDTTNRRISGAAPRATRFRAERENANGLS